MTKFNEDDVHKYLYKIGLESVIDAADLDLEKALPKATEDLDEEDIPEFELWMLLKRKAIEKLRKLHELANYGTFIGSNVDLPLDSTKPMSLDLIGTHEDGLFILELKVAKAAERNAFTELFAYSNYISGLFPGAGSKDILNILVAPIAAKITKQAYLYDLLISDRNIILYQPNFPTDVVESLRLSLYIPEDSEFQNFANHLLSHDAMSCVVASFPDILGWISYDENDPKTLPDYTRRALQKITSYTAQLLEKDGLHGFCFLRKRWHEIQMALVGEARCELIICAINPFRFSNPEKIDPILQQIDEKHRSSFLDFPALGFDGRLSNIARQTINESIETDFSLELEFPFWGGIVNEMVETVFSDNIGFRPTGMFREAYVEHLMAIHRYNQRNPDCTIDVERLQIDDITNWFRAWQFMEACGFVDGEAKK